MKTFTSPSSDTSFVKLSDSALYHQAKFYGGNALKWRQKFIGLLPEVQRRKLYERKGFTSIVEFAKKLAGLSEQQVHTALNLERKFSNTPELKSLLENGDVSINKLSRIASIATIENQSELAQIVQTLPQSAIETLVRDERANKNVNGLPKPLFHVKSLRAQDLKLCDKVLEKLLNLQEKGINVDELLLKFLEQREQEIEEEKASITADLQPTKSRYIPAKTRKILKKEHGEKCSFPNCKKSAEELHHTQRFALVRTHDPRYIAPMCENHHLLAHAVDVEMMEIRSRRKLNV